MPHHKVACFQCWGLLPAPLRVAVTRSRGGNRLAAVGDAARWLRENVAEGVRINQPKFRITFADGGAPR